MPRPALSVCRQRRVPRIRTHYRREVLIPPFRDRKSPRRRTRNAVRPKKAFRRTGTIRAGTSRENFGFPRETGLSLLRRKRNRSRNRNRQRPHSKIQNSSRKSHCHRHAGMLPSKRGRILRTIPGTDQCHTRLPLEARRTHRDGRHRLKEVGCGRVPLIPSTKRG